MDYPYLDQMIARAQALGPRPVAVTYPCSMAALQAAVTAQALGLINPLLVGPKDHITRLASESSLKIKYMELVDSGETAHSAALKSVELANQGRASLIMKGSLHTDELLGAMVSKASGMRSERRISHAFLFDIPGYAKPLLIADCVVNIAPSLMEKRDIIQNVIDLARNIGIAEPRVGILSAVETINPAIPSTIEAAALSKMAERGQITGAIVDGPLAFDVAISSEAARIKGLHSPVPGIADILIVPNLEAGNMVYKQLIYIGKAECAGLLLGTRVPVILTSRADSEKTRIASIALAILHARPILEGRA